MAKQKGDEEKPDGLEITSIGSLYTGPWDKKYWSSSRGKDRYPYPVGYEAVRAHNRSTYKIEIQEGPKGPLFMISSADGHSSFGQTPDIAWEKFQKKYCPRAKILQGKRLSCNIDGVEFFGFKNSLVQRLLREMVANVGQTVEQSLLSSSFCQEGPKADGHSDEHKHHDLLPLDRSQITGKRSKRREIMNTKSSSYTNLKRSRSQELDNVAEASNCLHGARSPVPPFKGKCGDCEQPSDLPPLVNLIPVQEEKRHISENDFPLNSVDIPNNLRTIVPSEEKRLVANSINCASTSLADNLLAKEKSLNRSRGTEVDLKDFIFSMALEVKDEEHKGQRDFQVVNDIGLYVPDTLDLEQDDTTNNGSSIVDKSTTWSTGESTVVDIIISEGLVSESRLEEDLGTSTSNGSSQKIDLDLVGQETAKSMMSFLLPQAIPLLKKASREKKENVSPLEATSLKENTWRQNKETSVSPPVVLVTENKIVDAKEQLSFLSTNKGSTDAESIVTLDKSVDQLCGEHAPHPEILPSFDRKADQVGFNDEKQPCNAYGQSTSIGEQNELLDGSHEIMESKEIFCYAEVHMDSSGILQQGDFISKSQSRFTIPYKNNCAEEIIAASHFADVGIDGVKLQGMLSSSNILQEDSGVKNAFEESDKKSFTQGPRIVYSRRKKVKTINLMEEKYIGPLSESIICRNFRDNYVSETCPTRNTIALERVEMGYSDEKSCGKDLSGVKLEVLGQSQSLHVDRTAMDSKDLLNNKVSAVSLSQDQSSMCASKTKETIYFLDQPSSCVQKSHIHVDMEVVRHKNNFVPNGFESSQEQGTSTSNWFSSIGKEFQYSSDVKLQSTAINKNLLGIGELVGRYLLPLPVLSLMVSTIGEEIHICALCGLLINKDRALFIYKVATQEPRVGHPSFVGHTSMTLPTLKDYFGREIALERSGLQFTPGGQYLVLLDSIRTPYCRQGKIPCLCPACASGDFEEDAVKIVEVKLGYVLVVVKLKTVERLQCVLVCEPNHLVAVGESGRLHLWVMNPMWSAQTEKLILPANDLVSPGLVELKRIPKCACLVVGHNGFGEFSLWDISKRILVSRFSAACTYFCEFSPVALFGWKRQGHGDHNVHGHVNRMMAATNMWFSEQTKDDSFLPLEEDIAVWLLVSVTSDSDDSHDYTSGNQTKSEPEKWRLALLVKNMVILGSVLDPSAAAIGASAGHGIIGTCDGLVYLWEMSTGTKLGSLHHFRGSSVSCIATDDSKNGAVAIADGEGQLLLCLLSQNNKPK